MKKPFFQQTYARRTANIFSAAITLFAVVFSVVIVTMLQRRFIDDKYAKITDAGLTIAAIVESSTTGGVPRNFSDVLKFKIHEHRIPPYISYTVYTTDDSQALLTNAPFIPIVADKQQNKQKKPWQLFRNEHFYAAPSVHVIYAVTQTGKYSVQTAMDLEQNIIPAITRELPIVILAILIPLIIIANIAASLIAERTMKSIKTIIAAANEISSSNLEQRIEEKGPDDEIRQLAVAFNNLFSRLETDFKRERQFTSDVSHEIRTPVSVILGHTTLLQRWGKNDPAQIDISLSSIQQEAQNMQELTENLLLLSRSESGRIPVSCSFIQVKTIFEMQKKNFEITNPDVVITCNATQDDVIYFDESRLSQIIKILITNSISYSNQQAVIDLSFSYISSGLADRDSWRITVTDHGNGISKKDLPFVFNRLYRGDESRTKTKHPGKGGNGLGLSIAQSMLTALNAAITADSPVFDSATAPGTIVTITGKMQMSDEE